MWSLIIVEREKEVGRERERERERERKKIERAPKLQVIVRSSYHTVVTVHHR